MRVEKLRRGQDIHTGTWVGTEATATISSSTTPRSTNVKHLNVTSSLVATALNSIDCHGTGISTSKDGLRVSTSSSAAGALSLLSLSKQVVASLVEDDVKPHRTTGRTALRGQLLRWYEQSSTYCLSGGPDITINLDAASQWVICIFSASQLFLPRNLVKLKETCRDFERREKTKRSLRRLKRLNAT